ncbi:MULTISPECIES: NAD(P)-dependent oxidoreductase [unclassified Paenibacillus]|uniref:NAD(P)-dependent oxidoreductase n=1 Tax=unclassified Paenibacillus TaxID=185978 RepID=UPI00363D7E34
MRLFIVGANGAVGSQMVQQALANGHQVTAFVRRQDGLVPHQQLNVTIGRIVEDEERLLTRMAGHDAVLSALGNGLAIKGNGGPKIMEAAMTHLVQAMKANGIQRLALLLSYGAGPTLKHANVGIRLLGKTLFRKTLSIWARRNGASSTAVSTGPSAISERSPTILRAEDTAYPLR